MSDFIHLPPIFDERGEFVRFGCVLIADARAVPLCGSFPGAQLDAGEGKKWNLLFPRGKWHGRNLAQIGGSIDLTDAVFAEMIENWANAGKPRLPVRKTHLHLQKDDPELQASYGDLEDFRVTAAGLEALTDWNDAGRAAVASRQWRGWSPEWYPTHEDRRTGETKGWWLSGTALTNDPFFISMPPVAASTQTTDPTPQHRSNTMTEEQLKLRASLGLASTATDAEVLTAQTKQSAELAALKASAAAKSDAAVITAAVEPVQKQVAALTAALEAEKSKGLERDVNALIATAKQGDGKTGRAITEPLIARAQKIAATEGLKASEEFLLALPLTVPTVAVGQSGTTGEALTASSASAQLATEVEKLTKEGNITPWLSAVARHPELARIAQEGK